MKFFYVLLFLISIVITGVFFLFRYEDRLLHTIEQPVDVTGVPSVDFHGNNTNIFAYMFLGCQMTYTQVKALHPDFHLISDTGNIGDVVLNGTYGYDNLAKKNE